MSVFGMVGMKNMVNRLNTVGNGPWSCSIAGRRELSSHFCRAFPCTVSPVKTHATQSRSRLRPPLLAEKLAQGRTPLATRPSK